MGYATSSASFPEYISGQSTISGAAAFTLTNVFGDNFSFVDSTETEYGLPARNFKSFDAAADEAAVSRRYGGIQYRPANEIGSTVGRRAGPFLSEKLKTRKQEGTALKIQRVEK